MSDLKIELDCPICMATYTDLNDIIISPFCNHALCGVCYTTLNNGDNFTSKYRGRDMPPEEKQKYRHLENNTCKCPLCRKPFVNPKELMFKQNQQQASRNQLARQLHQQAQQLPPAVIIQANIPTPPAPNQGANRVPVNIRDLPIPNLQPQPIAPPVIQVQVQNNNNNQNPHRSFGYENQARPRCLTQTCNTPRGTQRKCPNHRGVPCCRVCDTCFICKGILSRIPTLNNTSVITNPDPSIQHRIQL